MAPLEDATQVLQSIAILEVNEMEEDEIEEEEEKEEVKQDTEVVPTLSSCTDEAPDLGSSEATCAGSEAEKKTSPLFSECEGGQDVQNCISTNTLQGDTDRLSGVKQRRFMIYLCGGYKGKVEIQQNGFGFILSHRAVQYVENTSTVIVLPRIMNTTGLVMLRCWQINCVTWWDSCLHYFNQTCF